MIKFILPLCAVTLLAGNSGHVFGASQKGCFEAHIRESIGINLKVKTEYTKLAGKAAKKLLNTLITSEHYTLITAKHFDNKAAYFIANGMDLLCQEFVKMNEHVITRSEALAKDFKEFDWKPFKKKMTFSLKNDNISEIKLSALQAIELLNNQPNYHCFTKHMFESIYRIAHFIDIRRSEASTIGIKSPHELMKSLIKTHLKSFSFAQAIDQMAAPIQQSGVPILCNELPDLLSDLLLTTEQV